MEFRMLDAHRLFVNIKRGFATELASDCIAAQQPYFQGVGLFYFNFDILRHGLVQATGSPLVIGPSSCIHVKGNSVCLMRTDCL